MVFNWTIQHNNEWLLSVATEKRKNKIPPKKLEVESSISSYFISKHHWFATADARPEAPTQFFHFLFVQSVCNTCMYVCMYIYTKVFQLTLWGKETGWGWGRGGGGGGGKFNKYISMIQSRLTVYKEGYTSLFSRWWLTHSQHEKNKSAPSGKQARKKLGWLSWLSLKTKLSKGSVYIIYIYNLTFSKVVSLSFAHRTFWNMWKV